MYIILHTNSFHGRCKVFMAIGSRLSIPNVLSADEPRLQITQGVSAIETGPLMQALSLKFVCRLLTAKYTRPCMT